MFLSSSITSTRREIPTLARALGCIDGKTIVLSRAPLCYVSGRCASASSFLSLLS